jgi:ABC-type bacteriocin/lantibiotic exporter with double-glycine peptidase domain
VSYSYGNFQSENVFQLQNIDFKIPFGDSLAICGPSGSGKTTLGKLLVGLDLPDLGEIKIDDYEASAILLNQNKFFAYVPQRPEILGSNILDNFLAKSESNSVLKFEILELLKKFGLFAELQMDDLNYLDYEVKKMSGGQLQRLAICRAIYQKSRFILFDEPTSSLDILNTQLTVRNILDLPKNITKVIITHNVSTATKTNYKVSLHNGKQIAFEKN